MSLLKSFPTNFQIIYHCTVTAKLKIEKKELENFLQNFVNKSSVKMSFKCTPPLHQTECKCRSGNENERWMENVLRISDCNEKPKRNGVTRELSDDYFIVIEMK